MLVSLLFVVTSGAIATQQIAALSFPMAVQMARWTLALSGAVLVCTCFGACGAIRQTLRKGCFSGRRMLCWHQLLLILVLIFSVSQYEWLNKRERSMSLVMSEDHSYQNYDAFERRVSKYFNGAYFESLCSDDPSTTWLLDFVDRRCPDDMSQEYCSLSEKAKKICDTSCPAIRNANDITSIDLMKCCPSEELCSDGSKLSCPYHRCRVEILEELYAWVGPTKFASQFVIGLSALMLVLSCLLICFNPRDEIEIELLKTGVMSQEDVEAIRRLKESANVVTERGSFDVNQLDNLKAEQKTSKFGYRKRHTRVSPTNN